MKQRITSEKLYEGIGYMDDKWLALLDVPMTAKTKKNRRFVGYELKKLFGVKYLWVFLFVLLMLNTAIAWYTADHSYAAEEPTQMISEFFEEYFENPAELDAYYAEMQAFAAEQEELFREAMRLGNYEFVPETMPNLYSTDENYPDTRLFARLYNTIAAAREYPDVLEKVI